MEKTVKQTQTQDSTLLKDLATPISIVIAGFFIALAILFQGDISLNLDALKKAKTTATDTAGVKKLTQGGTVEDKFAEYSKELSLNVQDFTSCLNSGKFKDEVQKDFSDGSAAGVSGTPTLFINGTKIVGAQPYESIKATIDKELSAPDSQEQETKVEVSVDDDPSIGDANAKVTVIEFSDFQCPFCKRLYDTVYLKLKQEYVDTGKIRLVFRDYPLSFHPNAQIAGEAGECADDQGKFWELHDKLFEKQDEWASLSKK